MIGLVGLLGVVIGTPRSVAAQTTPKFEVSGGYQLLHLSGDVDETMPMGWYGDVAVNLNRYVGGVFQVGGNYKTVTETEQFGSVTATVEADLHVHEFMGGVRVNARSSSVTPFAQVLVGGVNGSAKVKGSVVGGGQTFFSSSEGDSSTDLGLAVGGGVNLHFTERVGMRVAADYLHVFSSEDEADDLKSFRFAVGAVFAF